MNITVTIEAPELVGAMNNLAFALERRNLLADAGPLDNVKAAEEKKEKQAPKKETKQAEPEKVEPVSTPEPEPVKEEPKKTSGISLDVVTTKTREFVQGNTANRKLLKGFLEEKGAPKVSELDPADYQAALDFMEENS